ncbi:MAG: neutral/alkaline non-lysosomal ceramidase N-terminal domain-containing protein [Clostridiales bacterium]|nr:neutral/alkaline non-lysosomal ceramidase N-terminal domain-containing protein [Clostridiales bacterium]
MYELKVGAAKLCINPTADMYPIPNKMTDFGLEPMSQEAPYDDMNCRAIAIDTGETKLMFLTFELAGAPEYPHYPEDIAFAVGFPPDQIFIMGTHNHSAPRYRKSPENSPELKEFIEKYEKIVYEQGIEACRQAAAAMRPARYGYGETVSNINVNRNLYSFGGYWVEGRNMNGYSDKTLSVIKFTDLEGKLIAAFLNHPTHATNIYMLKDIDHKAKTSGNFTGIACRFVEEHYGNGAVAMWTSGAAGNQNPLLSHGLQYEYPDGWTTQMQYPDGTGYMQMEYMGRCHGADCCQAIDAITRMTDRMPVSHEVKEIDLPANQCVEEWPPKDFSIVRNGGQGERDYASVPYGQIPAPAKVPEMRPGEPRELYLHLLKMGNIALLFANAEIFAEIGRDMKAASPMKNTIIVTHHYGKKCNYIFDRTSKDVLLPMAYGGVVPGSSDELITEGEIELFDKIL